MAVCKDNGNGTCESCGAALVGRFGPIYQRCSNKRAIAIRRAEDGPKLPAFSDIVIWDGKEKTFTLTRPPCRHIGEKGFYASGEPRYSKACGCGNTPEHMRPIVFTPVYECSEFKRCAPFAKKIDDEMDETKPCLNCPRYERQSSNAPSQ